jgi:HD-like signal output (HDOD) protein
MDILEKVRSVSELITFPRAAVELLSGGMDSKTAAQKLIHIIESDPVLTAKLLATANSAFYGLRWEVASIQQAVLTLGVDEVNRIVLACQLRQQLHSFGAGEKVFLNRVWKHSVVTAAVARLIKQYIHFHSNGEEFTGGILHDFGKILLAHHFPAELHAAQQLVSASSMSDVMAERSVLGTDHAEIGSILGETWGLPSSMLEIIQYHHDVASAVHDPVLISIVRFADLLTERWEHGIGERTVPAYLDEEPCWNILQQYYPELKGMHALDLEKPLFGIFESSREFISMFL